MNLPSTIPITITPEAETYIRNLGLELPFEEMVAHACATMPGVRSVQVEVQPPHDVGGDDVVLVRVERDDPQLTWDPADWEYGRWQVMQFAPGVCQYFTVYSSYMVAGALS